jgi:predicted TIM-barrel fold metal-dependent hydrolase
LYNNLVGMRALFGFDDSPETDAFLNNALDEYNVWALSGPEELVDRARRVAILSAETVPDLMAKAEALIERGARAVWVPSSPLAGRSPASPDLDGFWSTMERHDVAVTLHLGTEGRFRSSDAWLQAPAFKPEKVDSLEVLLEPMSMTTVRMPAETYLTALLLGGVFERHSRLRFGVIELGATWFGPLADHLDLWVEHSFKKRMSSILSMPPSEYLARNVRVTPFYFEPIAQYVERFPRLVDCYCYSTDYPHIEGGKEVKARSLEKLAPLGSEVVEKYFKENGKWLLPD